MSEIIQNIGNDKKDLFHKGVVALNMSVSDIIYIFLCYFMSSCTFFEGRVPFVLSAYAAAFSGGKWVLFAVASSLGLLRSAVGGDIAIYFVVLALSTLLMGILHGGRKFKAICVSAVFLLTSFIRHVIAQAYWVDYFLSIFETLLCFVGVYVFSEAVPLITTAGKRRCIMDTEVVSLFALLALALRCTVGFPLILGMDVSVVLAILLLLAINMEGDISLGTSMGVVFGFVTVGRSLSPAVSMGAFAFASFCCGVLNRYGKWGVVLGFVMANAALTAILKGEVLPFDIFEVLFAAIVFSVIPSKITGYISFLTSKTVHTATKAFVHEEKIQNVLSKKLMKLGGAYNELANAYDTCFESDKMSRDYIIRMLDSVSAKICPDCGLKYNCWERCYKDSYKSMTKMLEIADKKGNLESADMPEPLKGKCIKSEEFVAHFNTMFGIYKVEKMWQEKLNDARALVSKQLRSISTSIQNTSEVLNMSLDVAAEREIKTALDKCKIPFEEITCFKGSGNSFSMEILVCGRMLTKKEEKTILDIAEQITGKPIALIGSHAEKQGHVLTYGNCAGYRISMGNASVSKSGEKVSGDSFVSCFSPDGYFVAALSDGMGTGAEALEESRTATELLKNFVSSGMDVETSLRLINSSLLLRSCQDTFATMDVCGVDLTHGNVSIYKNGAATGYIKKCGEVIKIESDSLPFGVLRDYGSIKTTCISADKPVQIILMTDGVHDVFSCTGEGALTDIIRCSKTDNPQIVASEILGVALEKSCGRAHDDMSVCVINVWER